MGSREPKPTKHRPQRLIDASAGYAERQAVRVAARKTKRGDSRYEPRRNGKRRRKAQGPLTGQDGLAFAPLVGLPWRLRGDGCTIINAAGVAIGQIQGTESTALIVASVNQLDEDGDGQPREL